MSPEPMTESEAIAVLLGLPKREQLRRQFDAQIERVRESIAKGTNNFQVSVNRHRHGRYSITFEWYEETL